MALTAWVTAGAAAAETLRSWKVAAWEITAHSNDQTGEFSHCTASVPYRSGILLLFGVGRDFNWQMGLANPSWNLPAGASYRVTYQIDRGPLISAAATAKTASLVTIDLANSAALFKLFQRGSILSVQAEGDTFLFNLTNSSRALEMALACTNSYVSAGAAARRTNPFGGANPFGGSPPPAAKEAPAHAALSAEALAVTANVLSNAGIQGFRLMDSIPQELAAFHALWTAPGLTGGLIIDEHGTVDQALPALVAGDAKNCKGRFASAKLPTAEDGLAEIKTACEDPQKNETAVSVYVLAPRAKGGVYMFAIYQTAGTVPPGGGGSDAGEAGTRLLDATSRTLLNKP